MRRILLCAAAAGSLLLAGCGSSAPADEGTVKPGNGTAMNPSGKPQTSDQAAYASKMSQTGSAMNAQREKDAAAMAAARAKAGK